MSSSAERAGRRVAATVPMLSRGGPRRCPNRFGSWQLAHPMDRYSWRPRATGSVAGVSGGHARTSVASAMHTRATRPIMRAVQSSASLHDATVVLDDRVILRAVNVTIGPSLTLVRGPNGSGKTTLLRALAGLVPLARGDRRVSGDILYIGHRPMLLPGLTARENLEFFVRFRGGDTRGIDGALRAWGVGEDMDRPVERLSAGERRRAALARVETERVPLLLLDEPFADLDDAGVKRLRQTIGRARDDGRALVIATHAPPELDELAKAQVAIDDGAATAA